MPHTKQPDKQSMEKRCQELGFTKEVLSPSILIKMLSDELNKLRKGKFKAASIIQSSVAEKHIHLLENLSASEMWQTLQSRFEDVSPRSMSIILRQLARTMMMNSDDASQYCAHFEIGFDKLANMLSKADEKAQRILIESIVQGFMMDNIHESYAPLIAQIQKNWTSETTGLSKLSKAIVSYSQSLKAPLKALHTQQTSSQKNSRSRIPYGSCKRPSCVE